MFKDKIFREYDIRGVVGQDYDFDFAKLLAHALSQYIRQKTNKPNPTFAVGRDARPSGSDLFSRFVSGLIEEGFEVIELGIVPTPLVYFSSHYLNTDAAASITGSHNPSEYNGFKICLGTSTLHGSQIQDLMRICKSVSQTKPTSNYGKGSIRAVDVVEPYIKDVCSKVKITKKLTVALDSGNGTAAVVAPKLVEALGCKVIPLYCELDGNFPNHHPDPTVLENIEDLRAKVVETHSDVGIAYDGDADRIGAVDETGRPVYGDELMVLYSREILSRKPGAKILSEVKCSTRMYADIKKHGGIPIMWKTGHSLIKAKMKEERAELAGEMSGHMFFSDRYYGYDDAIYATARLLEILSKEKNTLSKLLSDLPKSFSTPELRVDCEDEVKFKIVDKVKESLSKKYKIIDIDGVRIETDFGWCLLRASNTQPAVVMRFEANSPEKLEEFKSMIEQEFENAKK